MLTLSLFNFFVARVNVHSISLKIFLGWEVNHLSWVSCLLNKTHYLKFFLTTLIIWDRLPVWDSLVVEYLNILLVIDGRLNSLCCFWPFNSHRLCFFPMVLAAASTVSLISPTYLRSCLFLILDRLVYFLFLLLADTVIYKNWL